MNGSQLSLLKCVTFCIYIFTFMSYSTLPVCANGIVFKAKPKRCIKAREDKICLSNIELYWQTDVKSHYCIFPEREDEPLECWNNTNTGIVTVSFQSDKSLSFSLWNMSPKLSISTVEIPVVYALKKRHRKSKRRRLWHAY